MSARLQGVAISLLVAGSTAAQPPTCPQPLGSWRTAAARLLTADEPAPPVDAVDVDVDGTLIAVADATYGSGRLRLLDGSDPSHPAELGWVGLPGNATAVALAPGMAAVAHSTVDWDICVEGGLSLVDIGTPERPVVVSTLPLESCVEDLALAPGVAYVVNDSELVVVDIARPEAPTELARYQPELIHVWRAQVVGNTLFVGDLDGKICAADITDPAAPQHLGCTVITDHDLVALDVRGDLAAAVIRPDPPLPHELVLVDVARPDRAVRLSATRTAGRADDVALVGGLAALGLGYDGGVQIFDLTDPLQPAAVGIVGPLRTRSHRLTISRNLLWLAEDLDGIDVFRIDACQRPRSSRRMAPD